jgi:hypothetical protein
MDRKREVEERGTEAPREPRRPYAPPAIRHEECFETVAAGCTQFTKVACGAGFQAS